MEKCWGYRGECSVYKYLECVRAKWYDSIVMDSESGEQVELYNCNIFLCDNYEYGFNKEKIYEVYFSIRYRGCFSRLGCYR